MNQFYFQIHWKIHKNKYKNRNQEQPQRVIQRIFINKSLKSFTRILVLTLKVFHGVDYTIPNSRFCELNWIIPFSEIFHQNFSLNAEGFPQNWLYYS